jgi:hypothetical protein
LLKRFRQFLESRELKTLYVNRPLINGNQLREWALDNGFDTTLAPDDMHATLAFSKTPVDWRAVKRQKDQVTIDPQRNLHQFPARDANSAPATVLKFKHPIFQDRWQEFRDIGASWDFPEYNPHVTISYGKCDRDLDSIPSFDGELMFGPEIFKEVNLNWDKEIKEV